MIKILMLCDKNYWQNKMSRVRFHAMNAIIKRPEIQGVKDGPNFEGWVDVPTSIKKHNPDAIMWYKPLGMQGYDRVNVPIIMTYNEMWDVKWTTKEIIQSRSNIIICHHYNDYLQYLKYAKKGKFPNSVTFKHIPHSAEQSIFKPMPEVKKKYDVIVIGATHARTMLGDHYPLRKRMCTLIHKLPKKYHVAVISHVGGNHSDSHTDKYAKDFAKTINSSKIVITDSGAPRSRFGKYIEIPMCGSAVAGDVYNDHPEDVQKLKEFLIEINMKMSDSEIIKRLTHYLENDTERMEKVKKGLEYTKEFTHEKYAERFCKVLSISK